MKDQEMYKTYSYGNNYIDFYDEDDDELCHFFIDDEI